MPSSGYAVWSVVADEQPTAAKWNILGSNDASFNNGNGIENNAIVNRHVVDGAITSRKARLGSIGAEGSTLNPIATALGDIANSSVTFTCDVASYLEITVTCRIQTNATTVADLRLVLDGAVYAFSGAENRVLYQENATSVNIHATNARTIRIPLAAGSHTIKLQAVASKASSAIAHNPSWWGTLIAQ